MKFLCHWRIPHNNWLPVLKKFTSMSPQEQKNAGDGVSIIGRWHDVAARTGVVVFEASDAAAVQRYLGHWNPFMEIDLAPDFRSTALLLVGWLAGQLQWTDAKEKEGGLSFRGSSGKEIKVTLGEKAGAPIGRCAVRCGATEFIVAHPDKADLLEVAAGERSCRMPAGRNEAVRLMGEELMRGGPHRVYLRAMNCVREFL